MNEYKVMWTALAAFLGLGGGALLYSFGGRQAKWTRRFIGSLVIALTVSGCALVMGSWNWWLIGVYPLLILGFVCGYGADTFWKKVYRRAAFAGIVMLASLWAAFFLGGAAWKLLPLCIGVGVWTIYLGVVNPIYAASEEFFICVLLNLGLVMMPFVVR